MYIEREVKDMAKNKKKSTKKVDHLQKALLIGAILKAVDTVIDIIHKLF
jgi:hypothetical protein